VRAASSAVTFAHPVEIAKPSRGLFTPLVKSGNDTVVVGSTEQVAATGIKVQESDFYHGLHRNAVFTVVGEQSFEDVLPARRSSRNKALADAARWA